MPFPRISRSKPSERMDKRPLLYAQSPSTPSLAPSSTTTDATSNAIVPDLNTLQVNDSLSTKTGNNTSQPKDEPAPPPPSTRPTTPPQGSNHNPWSSYHDLPPDHPVFRYPDAMREKMYTKGIGTTPLPCCTFRSYVKATANNPADPVVKAEMDLARLGKVYGEQHHAKGFWKRGTSMMGQFGTMARGGSF